MNACASLGLQCTILQPIKSASRKSCVIEPQVKTWRTKPTVLRNDEGFGCFECGTLSYHLQRLCAISKHRPKCRKAAAEQFAATLGWEDSIGIWPRGHSQTTNGIRYRYSRRGRLRFEDHRISVRLLGLLAESCWHRDGLQERLVCTKYRQHVRSKRQGRNLWRCGFEVFIGPNQRRELSWIRYQRVMFLWMSRIPTISKGQSRMLLECLRQQDGLPAFQEVPWTRRPSPMGLMRGWSSWWRVQG